MLARSGIMDHGENATSKLGLRPFVFAGGGLAAVDAKVPVQVAESGYTADGNVPFCGSGAGARPCYPSEGGVAQDITQFTADRVPAHGSASRRRFLAIARARADARGDRRG